MIFCHLFLLFFYHFPSKARHKAALARKRRQTVRVFAVFQKISSKTKKGKDPLKKAVFQHRIGTFLEKE
jgi:hypothetical protein